MYFQLAKTPASPSSPQKMGRRRSSLTELEVIAIKLAASKLVNDIALSGIPTTDAAVTASLNPTRTSVLSTAGTTPSQQSPTVASFRSSISGPLSRLRNGSFGKKSQDSIETSASSGRTTAIVVESVEPYISSPLRSNDNIRADFSPAAHLVTCVPEDLDSPPLRWFPHLETFRHTASAPTIPVHHLPRLSHLRMLRRSKTHLNVHHDEQKEDEEDHDDEDDDGNRKKELSARNRAGQTIAGETTAGIFTSSFAFQSQGYGHTPPISSPSTPSGSTPSWSNGPSPDLHPVELPIETEGHDGSQYLKAHTKLEEVTMARPALFRSLSAFLSHASHTHFHSHSLSHSHSHFHPQNSTNSNAPAIVLATYPSKQEQQDMRFEDAFPPQGQVRRITPSLEKWQEELTTLTFDTPTRDSVGTVPLPALALAPLHAQAPVKPLRSPLRPPFARSTSATQTLVPSDFAIGKRSSSTCGARAATSTLALPGQVHTAAAAAAAAAAAPAPSPARVGHSAGGDRKVKRKPVVGSRDLSPACRVGR